MKRLQSIIHFLLAATLAFALGSCQTSVPPLTNADRNEVVNLGDSIFALSGKINERIFARNEGTFRHYSCSGAQMDGGTICNDIPTQWNQAKGDDPFVEVVYMDGGGNDFLIPFVASGDQTCVPVNGNLTQACLDLIDLTMGKVETFLDQLYADNVMKVYYLGYYNPKNSIFGQLSLLVPALNVALAQLQSRCENHALECIYIDPRPWYTDSDLIKSDGIHPTDHGSIILGDLLYNAMVDGGTINGVNNGVCIRTSNWDHKKEGRAVRSGLAYYAVGSGDYLGTFGGTNRSLQADQPGNWGMVATCD